MSCPLTEINAAKEAIAAGRRWQGAGTAYGTRVRHGVQKAVHVLGSRTHEGCCQCPMGLPCLRVTLAKGTSG